MKNVLVSTDKLKELTQLANAFYEFLVIGKAKWGLDTGDSLQFIKNVLAMPDFVESEEDVKYLTDVINCNLPPDVLVLDDLSQAAINALKIKGE
jgi:hypothetical protein